MARLSQLVSVVLNVNELKHLPNMISFIMLAYDRSCQMAKQRCNNGSKEDGTADDKAVTAGEWWQQRRWQSSGGTLKRRTT